MTLVICMIKISPIIYQPDITSKFDLNIETEFAIRPKYCSLCGKIKEKAPDLDVHLELVMLLCERKAPGVRGLQQILLQEMANPVSDLM